MRLDKDLMIRTINFLGLPLITDEVEKISDWLVSSIHLNGQSPVIISHVNANNYYHICQDTTLCRRLKNNAHLLFDGIAMKLVANWLGLGWLPDLNGTDLFPLVMTKLVKENTSIYLLGGNEFVVASAVQRIRSRWPKVKIAGYRCGYFEESQENKIVETINASGAKVLLIGRGFVLQEEFALRQKSHLNVSLIWNVGGLFDFISGNKPRAPLWMRQIGLEWLFRLLREPRRLWIRTFIVGPWLASHILSHTLRNLSPFKSKGQMQQKEV